MGCGAEVAEPPAANRERPPACEDAEKVIESLRECVLSVPERVRPEDQEKTREGCFTELKVVCGYE